MVDATGSMSLTINAMTRYLGNYLVRICAASEATSTPLRWITLIGFRDHTGDSGTYLPVKMRSDNLEELIYALSTLKAQGGGDAYECMTCAINLARTLSPDAPAWIITDTLSHFMPSWEQQGEAAGHFRWYRGTAEDDAPCPTGEPRRDQFARCRIININTEDDMEKSWLRYGATEVLQINPQTIKDELSLHPRDYDVLEQGRV